MSSPKPAIVVDAQGASGTFEPADPSGGQREVMVRLPTGELLRVGADKLTRQADGTYRVQGAFRDFEVVSTSSDQAPATLVEEVRIPVAEEQLHVRKQVRETGRVRLTKRVQEHVETIDEPLLQERVEVRRIPVDRVVEGPVAIRQEGDTTIIPVVEERLVIQKQLVLKEELHVTRQRSVRRDPQEVILRSEDVDVERSGAATQQGGAAEE